MSKFIKWGIFTDNRVAAQNIMDNYVHKHRENIQSYVHGIDSLSLEMKDGSSCIWINPKNDIKGQRFDKAHIDLKISQQTLQDIIMPMLICDESNIELFDTGYIYGDLDSLIEGLTKARFVCGNLSLQTQSYNYPFGVRAIMTDKGDGLPKQLLLIV